MLDGSQATRLRALIAEQSSKATDDGGSLRGLARLLRRNPTDAERLLWEALRSDRRFAGHFKRQTPVGRHIPDFVSFPRRLVIEIINADDLPAIAAERDARKIWLGERDYRVMHVAAADIFHRLGLLPRAIDVRDAVPPAPIAIERAA